MTGVSDAKLFFRWRPLRRTARVVFLLPVQLAGLQIEAVEHVVEAHLVGQLEIPLHDPRLDLLVRQALLLHLCDVLVGILRADLRLLRRAVRHCGRHERSGRPPRWATTSRGRGPRRSTRCSGSSTRCREYGRWRPGCPADRGTWATRAARRRAGRGGRRRPRTRRQQVRGLELHAVIIPSARLSFQRLRISAGRASRSASTSPAS